MGTHRLLSDTELANFARFIKPNPQGAFDTALAKPAHIARLRKGIPMREFARGGAYDSSSPEDDLPAPDRAVLVKLAQQLSDVEWLALRRTLCGEGEGAEAEDTDVPDEERPAPAMDGFGRSDFRIQQDRYPTQRPAPAPTVSAAAAATFHEMFPGARRG